MLAYCYILVFECNYAWGDKRTSCFTFSLAMSFLYVTFFPLVFFFLFSFFSSFRLAMLERFAFPTNIVHNFHVALHVLHCSFVRCFSIREKHM